MDDDLVAGAREHLAAAGVTNVEVVLADGALGHPQCAPYNRVIAAVMTPTQRTVLCAVARECGLGRSVIPWS